MSRTNTENLVAYFKNIEKYKEYLLSKKNDNDVFYLYSKTQNFNIICIFSQKKLVEKPVIDALAKKMMKFKHHQPKILLVNLGGRNQSHQWNEPHVLEVETNVLSAKQDLSTYFANIHLWDQPPPPTNRLTRTATVEKISVESTFLSDQLANKEVADFLRQQSTKTLFTTWFFTFLFIFIPALWFIIVFAWKLNTVEDSGYFGFLKLFTGGTTHSLTIIGKQWWRIFTYGFAINSGASLEFSVLIFGLVSFSFYRLLRFAEVAFGSWKTFVTVLGAYFCTGFFMSIMSPETITGGIFPLLGIAIGIILLGTGSLRKPIYVFMHSQLGFPILLFALAPFLSGSITDYQGMIIGLAFSSCFISLLNNAIVGTKTSLIGFSIILSALLLIPFLFLVIPRNVGPAYNPVIHMTLIKYKEYRFLDESQIQTIWKNLGWSPEKLKPLLSVKFGK